jgi:PilZ domain
MPATHHLFEPTQASDRRTVARQNVSIPAKVGFRDRTPIACTVRNVSAMGALLEFGDDVLLPDNFRIIIESKMFWADCEVRHRKGRTAGVMFITNRMEALAAFG